MGEGLKKMIQVDQLVHQTQKLDWLLSILKNGLHGSYAKEKFDGRKVLIPTICFSNILYRDIGHDQIVDYGSYGISIDRDWAIKEHDLTPVMYYVPESTLEKTLINSFYNALHIQIVDTILIEAIKDSTKFKFSENIFLEPTPSQQIIELFDYVKNTTDRELIRKVAAVTNLILGNSFFQLLHSKPNIVITDDGKSFVAYNDREWRKVLNPESGGLIFETGTGEDTIDPKYTKWSKEPKPHLKEVENTIKVPIERIKCISVAKECEIEIVRKYIENEFPDITQLPKIDTISNLREN